jgi:hypothetical protein
MDAENFFERWSRPKPPAAEPLQEAPAAPPVDLAKEQPPLTLEDAARLTPESDFTPFVARGVDESVRRAALKKLFTDPHFNIMDGLDTYIDDYNKFEPIPAAMLAALNHAQALLKPTEQLENALTQLLQTPEEPAQDTHTETENPPEQASHDDTI